ncbi:MAG: DUF4372 domain-containing protein [Betaproteobacteria bacterium]|nr:DUF4372 domain-containing protein [Betaproteobacteria bacterium]
MNAYFLVSNLNLKTRICEASLTFSCRHQFFSLTFAKLTYLDSLRYIEDCFRAQR